MTTSHDYNLSFSGLKTFSRNLIAQLEEAKQLESQEAIYDVASSLQYGVFRHITYKLTKILEDHAEIREVWLGGGVAANITLRQAVRDTIKKVHPKNPLPLLVPYTKRLCQDNAAMIGVAAQFAVFSKNTEQSDSPDIDIDLDRKPNLKLA